MWHIFVIIISCISVSEFQIEAIDHDTHLVLFQMINNGIFEKNLGIVSTGKESIVLYCDAGENLASYMENKFTKDNNLPMSGLVTLCFFSDAGKITLIFVFFV